jgi:hypothetical protein
MMAANVMVIPYGQRGQSPTFTAPHNMPKKEARRVNKECAPF